MLIRLYGSFYLSIILHLLLIILAIGPSFKPLELICGLDKIIPFEEEKKTLSLEMSLDSGEEGQGDPKKAAPEGNTSEQQNHSEPEISDAQKENLKQQGWGELAEQLEQIQDLKKKTKNTQTGVISKSGVSDKYINRVRNYEDIILKDVFPSVYNIDKSFQDEIKNAPSELIKHNERNDIIEKFKKNELADEITTRVKIQKEGIEDSEKKILTMNKEERDKYFDKTLPLPKEEQLKDFVDNFVKFDPNKGDLPELFRDLYYKNLQRLAFSFSSDSSYFTIDYFQENLNKEDYLKNSLNLLSIWKGTKTATEILFSLENIYEIQANAIQQYFINQSLLNKKENLPELREETIRQVLKKYKSVFAEKKIENYEQVWDLYSKRKEEVLDYLLQTTPENYRRQDALFEKARVLWERGIRKQNSEFISKALDYWNQIQETPNSGEFLNKKTYEQIKLFLNGRKSISKSEEIQIESILQMRLREFLSEKKKREDRLLW